MRQISGSADQLRQQRRECLDGVLRGLAAGDVRAIRLQLGDVGVSGFGKALRQRAAHAAGELCGQFRISSAIGREACVPLRFQPGAITLAPARIDVLRDLEFGIRPMQRSAGGGRLVLAQRRAVRGLLAGLVRRTEANGGAAADQCRLVGRLQRGLDRGLDLDRIMPVHATHHVPAVGLETHRGVIGEPPVSIAIDTDVVFVPQRDELVQAQRARQRAGFVADALHQATIAEEHPGAMVDDGVAVAIEVPRQQLFSQRKANRIGQPLSQRPGGGFHARADMVLRMPRGLAAELAKRLQLLDRQVIAGQMQQRVLQHRAVAVGEDETVAIGPVRIGRIAVEVVVPQHLGDVGHAHRHARMAGIGGLHRVDGKEADGVGKIAAAGRSHGERRNGRNAYCPMPCRSSAPTVQQPGTPAHIAAG